MKIRFCFYCIFLPVIIVSAQSGNIYHKNYIDFNKNGRMDVYENPRAPADERIENLLSQMTLEEKTCQLATLYGYKRILMDPQPTPEWKEKIWKDGIGNIDEHLNGFTGWRRPPMDHPLVYPPSSHARAINNVQRWFVEETRLGIPVDFTDEGIRGVEATGATNFPTQLGIGHTWDKELVNKIGRVTAKEARVLGFTNVYSPILDVARDQRWGRMEEVYGESPFLVGILGTAMTRGMQEKHRIASTAKHFCVYSTPKGGREGFARTDPQLGPRAMHDLLMRPFEMVIRNAGLLGVMSSYNDYDGVPISGSSYFLDELLRKTYGFRGYVVTDSDALAYLYTKHGVAGSYKEAVRQAIQAGVNVRCTFTPPDKYILPLRELVREGRLSRDIVDDRVRDVLRVKFWLGLFDHPYVEDCKEADTIVGCADHQKVALRASRESLVLLKNEGGLLPLSRNLTHIAVIGPNAADTAYAVTHYGPRGTEVISVLEGIQNIAGSATRVSYTKGCELVDADWPDSELLPRPLTETEQEEIAKAVDLARDADAAILVVGGSQRTAGENKSSTSLNLPGRQLDLIKAVYATGTPCVVVLINGRPLSINWTNRSIPAILEAWYPGAWGGKAVAEVLFGDYNPGGKLTVTFPKTVGQIPFNFPTKPFAQVDAYGTAGPDGGRARVNGALYPFGYGLSYTTFTYSDLSVEPDRAFTAGRVIISCRITNSGQRAGDEVAQLYIHDEIATVTVYEKVLRGFERVHLEPGESKTVTFIIEPEDLMLWNRQMERVVEPGLFTVMVGASSEDIRLQGEFTILAADAGVPLKPDVKR